ncbi:class I histocompatibility antigen, F10 alpha chain-like [Engraulis encrasicolus]|uniref:class I histocompatibility antigen, F10 alpha chain-like n=1 Tax=Engraulis encrasicolus TaxID=184585 RepID=UPI002FD4646E
MVDEVQFILYDGKSQQAVFKQDWMEAMNANDPQYLQRQTQIGQGTQQSFKANIDIAKERLNQTAGVHTFQFMYGCQWDDETEDINAFRQYGYDGEDFISFDVKTMQYTAPVQQAFPTKLKWENSPGQLDFMKNYLSNECVEWLKKYVNYGRSSLDRKVAPEVSLLQKGSEVACHATGFYPDSVMIAWKKNGQEMDDDVDVGETLPNEDGTFQKRAVLTVSPEERKNAQYSCEVTHKSGEPINEVLDEAKLIRSNGDSGIGMGVIIGIIAAVLVVGGAIAGIVVMVLKKKDYEKASSHGDTNSDISNPNPIVRTAETEKLNADPSV